MPKRQEFVDETMAPQVMVAGAAAPLTGTPEPDVGEPGIAGQPRRRLPHEQMGAKSGTPIPEFDKPAQLWYKSGSSKQKSETQAMIPTLYLVLPVILIVVLGQLLIGVKEPVTVGRDPG
ncbi:MAG: hypothetical protein H8E47_01795 [Anaerolineales bacterium]|nr:hypothetical protein [Anaerolineales bacterium]